MDASSQTGRRESAARGDVPLHVWHEKTVQQRVQITVTVNSQEKGGLFTKASTNYSIITSLHDGIEVIRNSNDFLELERRLTDRFPLIIVPPLKEPFLVETLQEIATNPFIRTDPIFTEFVNPAWNPLVQIPEHSEGLLRWKEAISLRSDDNNKATQSFLKDIKAEIDDGIAWDRKMIKHFQLYKERLVVAAEASKDLANSVTAFLEHQDSDKVLAPIPMDRMLNSLQATASKFIEQTSQLEGKFGPASFQQRVITPLEFDIHILKAWKHHLDSVNKKVTAYAKLGDKMSKEKDANKSNKLEDEIALLESYLNEYEAGVLGVELERLRNQRMERLEEWQKQIALFNAESAKAVYSLWKVGEDEDQKESTGSLKIVEQRASKRRDRTLRRVQDFTSESKVASTSATTGTSTENIQETTGKQESDGKVRKTDYDKTLSSSKVSNQKPSDDGEIHRKTLRKKRVPPAVSKQESQPAQVEVGQPKRPAVTTPPENNHGGQAKRPTVTNPSENIQVGQAKRLTVTNPSENFQVGQSKRPTVANPAENSQLHKQESQVTHVDAISIKRGPTATAPSNQMENTPVADRRRSLRRRVNERLALLQSVDAAFNEDNESNSVVETEQLREDSVDELKRRLESRKAPRKKGARRQDELF